MHVYKSIVELQDHLFPYYTNGDAIGFVPTMGALHEGHLSLINKAAADNSIVVVSIFVNPTQFDNVEDLEKYPRTLERDASLLATLPHKIVVFAPSVDEIYTADVVAQEYTFDGLEYEMEGKFRTGHFNGVATIVKRLFEIVKPTNAYFGEKDFQQLQIIKKLVHKFKLKLSVIGCPIHREPDGLAMSSRNERLSEMHRKEAPFIFKTLKAAKIKFGTKSAKHVTEWVTSQFNKNDNLDLEYFVIAAVETLKPVKRKSSKKKYRAFIAAYAGEIRLIDNIALN